MIQGARSELMAALGEVIDKSEYAGVYGDLVYTHPELLQRFRTELVVGLKAAVDSQFGTENAEPENDTPKIPADIRMLDRARG